MIYIKAFMHYDYAVLALVFRFYSRALQFPFEEITHEYQHLFREMEKQVQNDLDEEVAAKVLDIINYYQGEEMSSLQGEFSRLFAFNQGEKPIVPVFADSFIKGPRKDALIELLEESGLPMDDDFDPDTIQNVLEYFAILLEEGQEEQMDVFFQDYIDVILPRFCEYLYQGTILNFYKELAKGLNSLVQILRPTQQD
jgi:TorA maturation chaperone TorD